MSKRKASFVEDNYYTKLEQLLKEEILEADVIFDNYISNRGQINRTFSKALMYFSYLVNRFKSMKVETDVNAFYKTLYTFNFISEDNKKEHSNGRYGLTNLVRTLFPHRKDAVNIVGRQLFEGEYTAQEQCNEILGEDWYKNANCYICNLHSDDLHKDLSCEHVLPVMQAATVTGLFFRGMSKELKKDLYKIVYAPACHCCNYAKNAIFFIDFVLEDWEWKHDPAGISEVINKIKDGGGKSCTEAHIFNLQTKYKKYINPETGKKDVNKDIDRYWQVRRNMKGRCKILNDYYLLDFEEKSINIECLDIEARKELYNYLTMANVLLSIRPENIQHVITNYNKKKRRQYGGKTVISSFNQNIFEKPINDNAIEIQTSQKTAVNKDQPNIKIQHNKENENIFIDSKEMNESKEDLNEYIFNEIMKDIETKQTKLDSIFEIVEQNIKDYQKQHPEVINSHLNRLIEFKKQHPEAFTDEGFNFDYWCKEEKEDEDTGGKKTKKTQKKNKSKKRKTKRKSKNMKRRTRTKK